MTLTVSRHAAPGRPFTPIAVAPAAGGATVVAVHVPARHAYYVACSRHGVLATDVYGADASSFEAAVAHRNANVRAFAHATGCEAKR